MSAGAALMLVGALVEVAGIGFLVAYRAAPWADLPPVVAGRLRRRRRRVPWLLAAGALTLVAGALWH